MRQNETQQDQPETLAELVQRYAEAYAKREAGILAFLDDEGELAEGNTYEAYDEHSYEAWSESHGDLGCMLSEIAVLVGPPFKVGDRVTVSADAKTASGGEVFFEAEVDGTVLDGLDHDGDIQVQADNGQVQRVAPRHMRHIAE